MPKTSVKAISLAELILNRTLSYQAAVAVHELKDRLGLDVSELRLTVGPLRADRPGAYSVTCTIATLQAPELVTMVAIVQPSKAIKPKRIGSKKKTT